MEKRSSAGSFLDFRFSFLGAGTPGFAQGYGGASRLNLQKAVSGVHRKLIPFLLTRR